MRSPQAAPGELELVRRFVNTRNIEKGTDELSTPEGVTSWFRGLEARGGPDESAGPVPAAAAATTHEVREVREVREALRAALLANHNDSGVDDASLAILNRAARRGSLGVTFSPDGWEPTARTTGIEGAIGHLLAIVVRAMADGTWGRLKACLDDECQWAFYDHSNARSSKWCDMRVCGNRAKQKAWRARRAAATTEQAPQRQHGAGRERGTGKRT
ncbi:CGNR zinc finger domain-containing protein [Intrasporangium sp.]|uniref:CGNR zinc finger domain-containing protein n=1 Tax=Intrasporangium sp. TaxID=1925024 RepID=UPI00293A6257|nr:CGNR zinc finger domain-containing protein [Intrasporangium sp.]MDV3223233.1 CGNR zinc finger domain-containing protein [Intrasporangium sp.]